MPMRKLFLAVAFLFVGACGSSPADIIYNPQVTTLTCRGVLDICREDAQRAGSFFGYVGRSVSCDREYRTCAQVGIDEYAAAWHVVCPSLGYARTSTLAGS